MNHPIFAGTGSLIDAFHDRVAAFECLANISAAEPSRSGVFMIAQNDVSEIEGATVFASSAKGQAEG